MFRSGYRRDFPRRALSESEITEAIKQDEKQRKHHEHEVIEVNGNGLVLQRLSDKQIIRRHRDDVKFAEKKKAPVETLDVSLFWFALVRKM